MGDDANQRGLSRKHIMHSIDDSLRRLGTDYVDLYQIHRFDPETPIEETIEALDDVVKMGKALYLGASSMYAWQFAKMLYKADEMGLTRFVSMQNHYNIVYREEEREMLPLCREEGIAVIPWSPLARGIRDGQPPARGLRGYRPCEDRHVWARDVLPAVRFRRGGPHHRGGAETGRLQRAGGAGVDVAAARRHRAHHRGQQDAAFGGGGGRARTEARRCGTEGAGRALPAAPRAGPRVSAAETARPLQAIAGAWVSRWRSAKPVG